MGKGSGLEEKGATDYCQLEQNTLPNIRVDVAMSPPGLVFIMNGL